MNDADWILAVVSSFYDKAKTDLLIGYHFRNISDFDKHIPRIATFWDFQLTGKSTRQISKPFDLMGVHTPLGIKRGELGRWLVLFRKTLSEQVENYPEKKALAALWEERLQIFEGIFLRNFRL